MPHWTPVFPSLCVCPFFMTSQLLVRLLGQAEEMHLQAAHTSVQTQACSTIQTLPPDGRKRMKTTLRASSNPNPSSCPLSPDLPQHGDIRPHCLLSIVCFRYRSASLDPEQVPLPMGHSLLPLTAQPPSLESDSALSMKN